MLIVVSETDDSNTRPGTSTCREICVPTAAPVRTRSEERKILRQNIALSVVNIIVFAPLAQKSIGTGRRKERRLDILRLQNRQPNRQAEKPASAWTRIS